VTLLAFAEDRRATVPLLLGDIAVDRYFLRAECSAANPPHAATPDRYIDPAPRTVRAMSITSHWLKYLNVIVINRSGRTVRRIAWVAE